MSVSCGLEWVVCLGCTRWAWKRLTYIGAYDSETWPPASADEFEPVPRLCRAVLANYDDELSSPKFAPPEHGYFDIDPKGILKRATYKEVGNACPPYLVYVDERTRRSSSPCAASTSCATPTTSSRAIGDRPSRRERERFDGVVARVTNSSAGAHGQQARDADVRRRLRAPRLLKAAKFILERETETLRNLLRRYGPEYKLILTGHSLGSGIAALMTVLVVNNRKEFDNIPRSRVKCYALAPARCMSLKPRRQDDFLPRTPTPLEYIFGSIFCTTSDHGIYWIERESQKALELMINSKKETTPPPQQKMERLQSFEEEHKNALQRAKTLDVPHAADLSEEEIQEEDSTAPPSDTHSETTTETKSGGRTSWDELMEKLFTRDEDGRLVVNKDAMAREIVVL
ncbi:hypothetical protein Zm00014a_038312 [Zea mays]|uniref:Fungal lipase-like domain-containing protein n=1 Tax=Zea mays TaxID=4577 RepID=A0A3L6D784_MAIZE|nr:hypothetical protein Zm00014a_038312 [Zea mays]